MGTTARGKAVRRALVAGVGMATGAGWVVQHRAVSRAMAGVDSGIRADELTVPADVTRHWVDTDDGGRIHAVERGSGPPVVLLHGVTLSLATWAHQLRDLAADHRIVAMDQRGHGLSLPGGDGFGPPGSGRGLRDNGPAPATGAPGIRRLAADVRCVLDALGIERAVLVGHSMGGMVALQLAVDMDGADLARRVAGLALVSTTAGPVVSLPGSRRVMGTLAPLTARALQLGARAGVQALPSRDLRWWSARLAFGADAPPALVGLTEQMIRATPPPTLAGLLGSLVTFDLSDELGRLQVPAMVVAGTHDRLLPPGHARRLAAGLPDAHLVELPRCGHMPMLERRYEFSRLVGEFAAKAT